MAKEGDKKDKKKQPTALKRVAQNEKRRLQNKVVKSSIRTAVKQFEDALTKGDAGAIKEKLSETYSLLDKAVKRGIYKQNKSGRTKSRLAARSVAKAK